MANGRDYTIIAQEQVRGIDTRGNVQDYYEIHYEGPNQIRGWIRYPAEAATPEAIDTEIRRKLANQITIHELGGSY